MGDWNHKEWDTLYVSLDLVTGVALSTITKYRDSMFSPEDFSLWGYLGRSYGILLASPHRMSSSHVIVQANFQILQWLQNETLKLLYNEWFWGWTNKSHFKNSGLHLNYQLICPSANWLRLPFTYSCVIISSKRMQLILWAVTSEVHWCQLCTSLVCMYLV